MYHSNTTHHLKETVIENLGVPDGVVGVAFANIALGMGVDFKDINAIIHYGAPHRRLLPGKWTRRTIRC